MPAVGGRRRGWSGWRVTADRRRGSPFDAAAMAALSSSGSRRHTSSGIALGHQILMMLLRAMQLALHPRRRAPLCPTCPGG